MAKKEAEQAESSKKATTNKKGKPKFWTRVKNFFLRIGRYFKNMWHELKKVTWPTRKDVINYSLVVLAFMVVMGVIIGVIDFASGELITLIVSF